MNVRHRRMQPEDIPECMELLANDPVIGKRYEPVMEDVPNVWLNLLQSEACVTALFRIDDGPRPPVCLFGLAVMVRDDFIKDLKTEPLFWIGPELTRRIARDESPVLTGKEIREANSGDGLSLVCWDPCILP